MEDLEFAQKCAKGDNNSWDEFLKKYSRLIYNYIYQVLNNKGYNSNQYLHDIFQEFFYFLIKDDYKKLKTFKAKNGCSLASWLRQVTINFTLNYIRRIKPEVSLDEQKDEDGLSLKGIIADENASRDDYLAKEEKLDDLKDCIQALNSDEKMFIDLNIFRGIPMENMKDYFQVGRPALDMRKSRIIEKLRNCFKIKGFMLDF